jgi:hypothetical protein
VTFSVSNSNISLEEASSKDKKEAFSKLSKQNCIGISVTDEMVKRIKNKKLSLCTFVII